MQPVRCSRSLGERVLSSSGLVQAPANRSGLASVKTSDWTVYPCERRVGSVTEAMR